MAGEEILVIEDEVNWQRELKHILEKAGYEVNIASGYAEAITALKQKTAKVAIVDISLVCGDYRDRAGYDVIKVARIPVVVLSGYIRPDDVSEFTKGGHVSWFFSKSRFEQEKFLQAVAEALG